ncbi:hypothetical protein B8W95_13725, partial [Staphylococcus pasteuri]
LVRHDGAERAQRLYPPRPPERDRHPVVPLGLDRASETARAQCARQRDRGRPFDDGAPDGDGGD